MTAKMKGPARGSSTCVLVAHRGGGTKVVGAKKGALGVDGLRKVCGPIAKKCAASPLSLLARGVDTIEICILVCTIAQRRACKTDNTPYTRVFSFPRPTEKSCFLEGVRSSLSSYSLCVFS